MPKTTQPYLQQSSGLLYGEDSYDHEFVIELNDQDSGLQGFIAIHSTRLGPAHGGTRMMVYSSKEDAKEDALRLSRAMTYKSALANLPFGGAKGVILLQSEAYDKQAILTAYAKKIEQLGGLFHTGTDVGLSDTDTRDMAEHCKYILGVSKADHQGLTTSKAAALGTFYAIQAAAQHRYGSDKLTGKAVTVKGIGKLGGELVRLLLEAGAHVQIADIDNESLRKLVAEHSELTIVDPATIHKLETDIYAPCAMGDEFTLDTVEELACDIIAGSANNQLASPAVAQAMYDRGILYAPDYVVNAGGLIFVSDELEPGGFQMDRVRSRLLGIKDTLTMIFRLSDEEKISTDQIADRIAQERIRKGL